jgi:hypothetical protein
VAGPNVPRSTPAPPGEPPVRGGPNIDISNIETHGGYAAVRFGRGVLNKLTARVQGVKTFGTQHGVLVDPEEDEKKP